MSAGGNMSVSDSIQTMLARIKCKYDSNEVSDSEGDDSCDQQSDEDNETVSTSEIYFRQ